MFIVSCSPDRWLCLQIRVEAIGLSFTTAECSKLPAHPCNKLKKCLHFQARLCVSVCVPSSANVWSFVHKGDKWRLGKMLGDSWKISSVWEPSLAATSTAAHCYFCPFLSSLSHFIISSCGPEEAVCDKLGFSLSLFSKLPLYQNPISQLRFWQWPQTTSQLAPLFFCWTCFSHASGDASEGSVSAENSSTVKAGFSTLTALYST